MPVLQLQFNLSALEMSPCEVAKTNAVPFELHNVCSALWEHGLQCEKIRRNYSSESQLRNGNTNTINQRFCDARKCSKFKRNECNAKCSLSSALTVLQMLNKL